jgi:hypothetical protein
VEKERGAKGRPEAVIAGRRGHGSSRKMMDGAAEFIVWLTAKES